VHPRVCSQRPESFILQARSPARPELSCSILCLLDKGRPRDAHRVCGCVWMLSDDLHNVPRRVLLGDLREQIWHGDIVQLWRVIIGASHDCKCRARARWVLISARRSAPPRIVWLIVTSLPSGRPAPSPACAKKWISVFVHVAETM
jgi:hypothetical protein